MSIELTILCDNSVEARPGLIGEHGFACHVQAGSRSYLFDTGSGLGLLSNARACNIDLAVLDAVLLSHGHWDHCGGLLPLLELRDGRPLDVYAHPRLFCERISRRDEERDLGPGFSRAEAEALGACFILDSIEQKLPGGLIFSGEVPRRYAAPQDDDLLCREEGSFCPDRFPDDQSLYLEGEDGLTILCGCAHAGVRNIIAHAIELTGAESLHGLIGGLHLMFIESEQEDQVVKDLEQHDIGLLALSHCTGPRAVARLMTLFDDRVGYAAAGRSFSI